MQVAVLYRDIRTYGEREDLYYEARKRGVIFIRYDMDRKPDSVAADGDALRKIDVWEPVLQRQIQLDADMLVLAAGIVPRNNEELAQGSGCPLTRKGSSWKPMSN